MSRNSWQYTCLRHSDWACICFANAARCNTIWRRLLKQSAAGIKIISRQRAICAGQWQCDLISARIFRGLAMHADFADYSVRFEARHLRLAQPVDSGSQAGMSRNQKKTQNSFEFAARILACCTRREWFA
jgi:hypothetical protein